MSFSRTAAWRNSKMASFWLFSCIETHRQFAVQSLQGRDTGAWGRGQERARAMISECRSLLSLCEFAFCDAQLQDRGDGRGGHKHKDVPAGSCKWPTDRQKLCLEELRRRQLAASVRPPSTAPAPRAPSPAAPGCSTYVYRAHRWQANSSGFYHAFPFLASLPEPA